MVKNKIIKKSIIAIGNFDGVHKGHQDIFRLGKKIAKKKKNWRSLQKAQKNGLINLCLRSNMISIIVPIPTVPIPEAEP